MRKSIRAHSGIDSGAPGDHGLGPAPSGIGSGAPEDPGQDREWIRRRPGLDLVYRLISDWIRSFRGSYPVRHRIRDWIRRRRGLGTMRLEAWVRRSERCLTFFRRPWALRLSKCYGDPGWGHTGATGVAGLAARSLASPHRGPPCRLLAAPLGRSRRQAAPRFHLCGRLGVSAGGLGAAGGGTGGPRRLGLRWRGGRAWIAGPSARPPTQSPFRPRQVVSSPSPLPPCPMVWPSPTQDFATPPGVWLEHGRSKKRGERNRRIRRRGLSS